MNAHTSSDDDKKECETDDMPPGIVRAFIRGDYELVDPLLPAWLKVLTDVGAGECFHKKCTFKTHLFEVYKILKIWGQSEAVCRCGLFHSAYSNSYVNLAIFQSGSERRRVQQLVGEEAEELIHKFCVVPRHDLIIEQLLGKLGDDALVVPEGGLTVSHIRSGQPLHVDRPTIAAFLVMTMADFAEQLYHWQDRMFENDPAHGGDGKLRYAGSNAGSLWPGDMRPGLWHSALSRMGVLLRSCGGAGAPLPRVFDSCSVVLAEEDQVAARDAYWQAATSLTEPHQHEAALQLLHQALRHNRWLAEPHVLIAQILMQRGEWEAAQGHARQALQLLCEWGTCWDKRMSWEVWVAMTRVLLHNAAERKWPSTPMGMLNLGLVPCLLEPYKVQGPRV